MNLRDSFEENVFSINDRIELSSYDGTDRGISPVSSLKISYNESDDQLVASVWSSDLRRLEVKELCRMSALILKWVLKGI